LRDTIPDVEAGGHRAEVRPLAARLGLRLLLAERAARLADDLADVDALAGGVDVEREIALAFELVLLRHVAQQRPDGDARQRVLQRDVAVGLRAKGSRERALVEVRRVRRVELAAGRLDLGLDVRELQAAYLQRADLQLAFGVE